MATPRSYVTVGFIWGFSVVGIIYFVCALLIAQGLGWPTFDFSNIVGTLTEGGLIALAGGGIGACVGSVLRAQNPELDRPSQDVKAQPEGRPPSDR